ncbi:DNase I-like protein, partial [Pseudomassariella vexata]
EINVITLNCWGLLHISAQRSARLTAIGRALAATSFSNGESPHIVALQECWTQEDYQSIRRETRFVLPYGKFYHSGAFGGGLAILSRWPIEESSMHRYPLNGRPTAFWRGDWFVGKGIGCARVRYGNRPRDVVEVFNTHTHAIYEHAPRTDSYHVHRLSQAWELSKLLRGAAARGHLVLALGDFNDVPLSLTYRVLTAHAPIRDVWRVLHPDSSLGAAEDDLERARRRPIPTAEFNVVENGVTSNSVYNTWRWPKKQQKQLGRPGRDPIEIPPDSLDKRGKRLDYIFASSGAFEGEEDVKAGWVVKDARVAMLHRHPELQCSLSDHFSVEATLVLHRVAPTASPNHLDRDGRSASRPDSPSIQQAELNSGAFLDVQSHPSSVDLFESGPKKPHRRGSADEALSFSAQLEAFRSPVPCLPAATYDEILTLIQKYEVREKFQRRWRGVHFFTWVVVTIVCWVGVWFTPPYVSFILMLLSSLGLVAGVIDGLVSLLFIGTELRALKEFEWEMMNAKAIASG